MKIDKARFVCVIFFLSLIAVNAINSPAQNKRINPERANGKSAEILLIESTLADAESSIGKRFQLILTIKNNSDYPIELFDPTPERGFDIEVKNSKGVNISLTKEGVKRKYPDIIMGRETIRLEPGKELTWKIDLNKLFDISQPDDYSVAVKVKHYYPVSAQDNSQNSGSPISSNTVKLKLTEREKQ